VDSDSDSEPKDLHLDLVNSTTSLLIAYYYWYVTLHSLHCDHDLWPIKLEHL